MRLIWTELASLSVVMAALLNVVGCTGDKSASESAKPDPAIAEAQSFPQESADDVSPQLSLRQFPLEQSEHHRCYSFANSSNKPAPPHSLELTYSCLKK